MSLIKVSRQGVASKSDDCLRLQAKLEEAEGRLESLKSLEAKIADLESQLAEKSKNVEVCKAVLQSSGRSVVVIADISNIRLSLESNPLWRHPVPSSRRRDISSKKRRTGSRI